MHSVNYEWFITQTVEAMLPCFHDERICLSMKIKMKWTCYPEETLNIRKPKTFGKNVLLIFHRPSRYTKVLYNVNRQYFINKKEMKMDQLADHDTSWKSDGMKWVFKSFVEAWDYFNEFGIEGRDIEPLFCYDNGSPAYYHLEKFEKDETNYIVKIGEKIPISKISQYMKN